MADGNASPHRDLVAHAQNGDAEAFRALYLATAPRLLAYLRSLVGDNDADDVAGETWARIVADLSAYRPDRGEFRTWVTTIARHRAIDHLRLRRARPAVPLPPEELPHQVSLEDTERDAAEAIGTARAVGLLTELPHGQAAAVLLCVMVGLDSAAAGRILRKQPGAVRTALHRGLKTLSRCLHADCHKRLPCSEPANPH